MSEKQVRRQFTTEFKREAVSLVTDQGYTLPQAAEALGIKVINLRRWKRQFEEQASGASLSSDEKSELEQLRREVKTLRLEKEILKKASAFFAKEMK